MKLLRREHQAAILAELRGIGALKRASYAGHRMPFDEKQGYKFWVYIRGNFRLECALSTWQAKPDSPAVVILLRIGFRGCKLADFPAADGFDPYDSVVRDATGGHQVLPVQQE